MFRRKGKGRDPGPSGPGAMYVHGSTDLDARDRHAELLGFSGVGMTGEEEDCSAAMKTDHFTEGGETAGQAAMCTVMIDVIRAEHLVGLDDSMSL